MYARPRVNKLSVKGCIVTLCLIFLRTSKLFYKVAIPFSFPPAMVEGSSFSPSWPKPVIVCLFDSSVQSYHIYKFVYIQVHHYSQDTEQCHYHKASSRGPFITIPNALLCCLLLPSTPGNH